MRTLWTDEQIKKAKRILRRTTIDRFQDAVQEIESETGRDVTAASLRGLFLRMELGPPTSYCKPSAAAQRDAEEQAEASEGGHLKPDLQKLFKIAKREPVGFSDLCDKMDLSPSKTRGLIEEARGLGIFVRVEHNHVGIVMPTPEERIRQVGVAPVVGERQKVAVISDTHLGSKYCLRDQLKEFVHYAYDQGVREILHPGDVVDGDYRHGKFEMSHMGLDAQADDLFDVLPKLPGLSYHGITGNHDFTFTEQSGIDVGHYLSNHFKERGRNDLHFYGNRGAFLKIRGAVVHLWHPRSVSYARSYAIQKHIEKYSSGEKPQILLCGHWHVFCHVYERGVHGIACPTFQGGGSAFGKSLGGAPAIGGLIMSWDLTEDGTMRAFCLEKRSYFEKETPIRVDDRDGAIQVEARDDSPRRHRRRPV